MTRFALCCAALSLCFPLGCMDMGVDEDDGDEERRIPGAGAVVPEIAEGPCSGAECNGRKPYGANCEGDARVLARKRFSARSYGGAQASAGLIELLHSGSCGTKWARITREDRGYSIAWVEAEDRAGRNESESEHARRNTWSTSMFYAPDTPVRACAQPLPCKMACENRYASTYCTDYR